MMAPNPCAATRNKDQPNELDDRRFAELLSEHRELRVVDRSQIVNVVEHQLREGDGQRRLAIVLVGSGRAERRTEFAPNAQGQVSPDLFLEPRVELTLNRISSSRLNHAFMISGRSPIAFWNTLPSMAPAKDETSVSSYCHRPESYCSDRYTILAYQGVVKAARVGRDSRFEIRNG